MKKSTVLAFWTPGNWTKVYNKMELFEPLLGKDETLIFIDCHNQKDPHSLRLLWEADLVVVWLKQDPRELESYFSIPGALSAHVFYLIYDYFEECPWNCQALHRTWRIPEEQLGVIPYNSRLDWFDQKGRLKQYLTGCQGQEPYEDFFKFLPCLKQAAQKIHQALFRSSGTFI